MATATPLPISVSEYLHTSYRPDCDFVDGVVEERNVGLIEHSEMLGELIWQFRDSKPQWGVHSLPTIRIRVSDSRVRVADVALISVDAPREQVIQTPPVAVVEILSPEDRIPRYAERLEDYRRMGVTNVWVVDPATRKGFDCSSGEWVETGVFDAGPIHIDLASIFAAIDEDRAR
ncbi:Uma2 family endonuclease [Silvibacterium acidisoli]|uniref:Uma2 family endonuclease n=1 Tax=Acidobacteriaceae bacterium ZG23-2 TaxID=2883246 RepID=UPI00406C78AE